MKSFNVINKKQKVITIILLIIIVISFLTSFIVLMNEDNYQTEIVCLDGTVHIVPGKVENVGAYCYNHFYIITGEKDGNSKK